MNGNMNSYMERSWLEVNAYKLDRDVTDPEFDSDIWVIGLRSKVEFEKVFWLNKYKKISQGGMILKRLNWLWWYEELARRRKWDIDNAVVKTGHCMNCSESTNLNSRPGAFVWCNREGRTFTYWWRWNEYSKLKLPLFNASKCFSVSVSQGTFL